MSQAADAARRRALLSRHNSSYVDAHFASTTVWMLRGSPVSQRNLRRELGQAGLAPSQVSCVKFSGHFHFYILSFTLLLYLPQLVFAPRVKVKKHLRRASLCDIALDTHEYNSGATAADTLYAGVPTMHLPGNKAVGRMLSAMLNAARLPELIVRDFSEYETLLTRLLTASLGRHAQPFTPGDGPGVAGASTGSAGLADGGKLKKLSDKLRRGILWAPLFDVGKWVSDFEQLSRMTWEVHLAGLRPMHIIPVRPLHWF